MHLISFVCGALTVSVLLVIFYGVKRLVLSKEPGSLSREREAPPEADDDRAQEIFLECLQEYEQRVLAYLIGAEVLDQKASLSVVQALRQKYGHEIVRPSLALDTFFSERNIPFTMHGLRQLQQAWIVQNGGNGNVAIVQSEIYKLLAAKVQSKAKQIVSEAIAAEA